MQIDAEIFFNIKLLTENTKNAVSTVSFGSENHLKYSLSEETPL